jgi:hypothetical protein
MPVLMPVDLDAAEERISPHLSLRTLGSGAAAAAAGFAVLRVVGGWPTDVRLAAVGVAAVLGWVTASARFDGAGLPQWLVRAVTYALAPRWYGPDHFP